MSETSNSHSIPQVVKKCDNCGKLKYGKDYFKSDKRESGLTKWCMDCLNEHNNKPPEQRYKKCKKCGKNREKWNYFKSDKQKDGLSAWCKPCHTKNK